MSCAAGMWNEIGRVFCQDFVGQPLRGDALGSAHLPSRYCRRGRSSWQRTVGDFESSVLRGYPCCLLSGSWQAK